MIRIVLASLWNRRTAAALTVLGIALSVALLLTVENLRRDARTAFANTVSGTDLIVGAPVGDVQLLLQTVFRIGYGAGNVSWKAFETFHNDPRVAWAVPISLGDSYQSYPVLGTTADYFSYFRVGRRQALAFRSGQKFSDPFDAVIGAEVADALGIKPGQQIVLAHGHGEIEQSNHEDNPFTVVGVLQSTGTPVDQTIHVSLEGLDKIHDDDEAIGTDPLTALKNAREKRPENHAETSHKNPMTGFFLGVKRKTDLISLQRDIGRHPSEALQAVIPGFALQQLWSVFSVVEDILSAMAWLVVFAGLISMLIAIVSTLESRRREMAVLRAVGASPVHLGCLFVAEAAFLAILGIGLGVALKTIAQLLAGPWVAAQFGVQLPVGFLSGSDLTLILAVFVCAILVSLLPAWRAMKLSLSDGLSVRQ